MGLSSDMRNLTEDLLASFKLRIKENEELVNDVQKTLDGFRKDQQEMAATLNANAAALRKGLARGEKDRISTFNELMGSIHGTISSIQKEVIGIQTSTIGMMKEFTTGRTQMAEDMGNSFSEARAERMNNEKNRMKEFDTLMRSINKEIKTINDEVLTIFKNTNSLLDRFENEHKDMSAELKAELAKNLAERVEYTKTLLNGFQKRLAEISRENQKTAQKLRKDLANGEVERIHEYNVILKGIHAAIKGISKEVKDIQKATGSMLEDLLQNRVEASAEWNNMQDTMARIRGKGDVKMPKTVAKKEAIKVTPDVPATRIQVKKEPALMPTPKEPMTLEAKILDFINEHPNGVRIAEMEEPLGEARMKLGFIAKNLLDE